MGLGVFISYSRQDFYLAEQLYQALRERRAEAWMELHRLRFGDDWWTEVQQVIGRAELALWVASRSSLRPGSVAQKEFALARELGRPMLAVTVDRAGRVAARRAGIPATDLRRGLQRTVDDVLRAADVAGTASDRLPQARPLRLVQLSLLGLALTFAGLLAFYALQLSAPISDAQGRQDALSTSAPYVHSLLKNISVAVTLGGATVTCGLALLRRRWRLLHTVPVVICACTALGFFVIVPALVENVDTFPGPGLDRIHAVADVVRPLALVSGILGLIVAGVLICSRGVLLRSVLGSGSPFAYERLKYVVNDEVAVAGYAESALSTANLAFSGPSTYSLTAHSADAGIARNLRRALADLGWQESANPDHRLVLITNATSLHQVGQNLGPGLVPVLGARLERPDPDLPLLRNHVLDFRRGELRLTSSVNGDDLVPTPVAPDAFDAPGRIRQYVRDVAGTAVVAALCAVVWAASLVQNGEADRTVLLGLVAATVLAGLEYLLIRERLAGWWLVQAVHLGLGGVMALLLLSLWASDRGPAQQLVMTGFFAALFLLWARIPAADLRSWLPQRTVPPRRHRATASFIMSPFTWLALTMVAMLIDVRPLW